MEFKSGFDPSKYSDTGGMKPGRYKAVINEFERKVNGKRANSYGLVVRLTETTNSLKLSDWFTWVDDRKTAMSYGRARFAEMVTCAGVQGVVKNTDDLVGLEVGVVLEKDGRYMRIKDYWQASGKIEQADAAPDEPMESESIPDEVETEELTQEQMDDDLPF